MSALATARSTIARVMAGGNAGFFSVASGMSGVMPAVDDEIRILAGLEDALRPRLPDVPDVG